MLSYFVQVIRQYHEIVSLLLALFRSLLDLILQVLLSKYSCFWGHSLLIFTIWLVYLRYWNTINFDIGCVLGTLCNSSFEIIPWLSSSFFCFFLFGAFSLAFSLCHLSKKFLKAAPYGPYDLNHHSRPIHTITNVLGQGFELLRYRQLYF